MLSAISISSSSLYFGGSGGSGAVAPPPAAPLTVPSALLRTSKAINVEATTTMDTTSTTAKHRLNVSPPGRYLGPTLRYEYRKRSEASDSIVGRL
mmetsp:Transcript_18205/g.36717  ORF Transcript_18205/g.36717 Transcript_18205/m.36717 type:complete len:95 (-) Transcript_18205:10-294(-)